MAIKKYFTKTRYNTEDTVCWLTNTPPSTVPACRGAITSYAVNIYAKCQDASFFTTGNKFISAEAGGYVFSGTDVTRTVLA